MKNSVKSLCWIAVVALAAAESVEACSASDAIDRARKSNDVYSVAKDVVSELLDKEGINKDVTTTVNDIATTALEVSTGAVMVDRYGKVNGDGTLSSSQLRSLGLASSTGQELEMTAERWRSFLDFAGGRGSDIHGTATVRDHCLLHAREIVGAPTPSPSKLQQATPVVAPVAPVPAVDHAG